MRLAGTLEEVVLRLSLRQESIHFAFHCCAGEKSGLAEVQNFWFGIVNRKSRNSADVISP